MAHKFAKGKWNPVKHPGSETKRAQEHGRSLHEQEEVDSHSPNKRIRGKGIFGLNAARGSFKQAVGKKKPTGKAKVKKTPRKRVGRKRG